MYYFYFIFTVNQNYRLKNRSNETDPRHNDVAGGGIGSVGGRSVVGRVSMGSGWVGLVGVDGCCLHMLHLKSVHRQTANHLSFTIRLASQANEPKK